MSKCKFKVGDRVRVLKNYDLRTDLIGLTGTIVHIDNDGTQSGDILVEFDEDINGHSGDCSGKSYESGHCWWLTYTYLEAICKFKVGDTVIGNSSNYSDTNKGWIGEVVHIHNDGNFAARGRSRRGDILNFVDLNPKYFDLYTKDQPTKIVITTDGKTTTAKMYRDKSIVKVETTKCHPDDRFDFMVGARVAFDRLMGEKKEEPKYYNGKVVCVNTCGLDCHYTRGKIYQFVDGLITDDRGHKISWRMKSFDEWQNESIADWLEVVE